MGEVKSSKSAIRILVLQKNAAKLKALLQTQRSYTVPNLSEYETPVHALHDLLSQDCCEAFVLDRELLCGLMRELRLPEKESDHRNHSPYDSGTDSVEVGQQLVGSSRCMRAILRQIATVASTESNVLIQGDSGTGKEVVARTIHACSRRSKAPFVSINCAAVPESLLESELFGHVKGAFTGAFRDYKGRFKQADGGTILLDEICSMPLSGQVKLLRVLQEKEVLPIGGTKAVRVNVRVIATTNRNLLDAVKAGTFREDLYYRLSVFPIYLPPLRERKEDIPLLARHFLKKFNRKSNKSIQGFYPETLALLMAHDWPGNVRELENTVEYAVIVERGRYISPSSLPPHLSRNYFSVTQKANPDAMGLKEILSLVEKQIILEALERAGWVKKKAAEILRIDPRNFNYYLMKNNIDLDDDNGM